MGFKKNFLWGVATAAYQIEGAASEDGRGESIWDLYCKEPGKIRGGRSGQVSCDHYHLFKEDVDLMKEMGVNAYRFSISWTRLIPDGIGEVNLKGTEFYNNLINRLIENNIIPMITLFHWDYPIALENLGGWRNPQSPKWFEYYTKTVIDLFSDRVKYFITFNEPQCFIRLGYGGGDHAPGYNFSD